MYIYRTYFKLNAPVLDKDEAQDYLSEDDMVGYLINDDDIDSSITDAIEDIYWVLKDEESGYIELKTTRKLSDKELKPISDWVGGQNADGLGEGFEQQDFASYPLDEDDEDADYDDEWVMASFDWRTNDYIFEFIREE